MEINFNCGKNTLISYQSSVGENIRVVSGKIIKDVCINEREDRKRMFYTRVYVNSELVKEYSDEEIPKENLLLLKCRLEKLSESEVDSEELMSNINDFVKPFEVDALLVPDWRI